MAEGTVAMAPAERGFPRGPLRLLRIGWILFGQYRALRTFSRMGGAERERHRAVPRRFVQRLLDLGPLFVKLGQILREPNKTSARLEA
jgi:predicted unusual protein kinase regulating ubiquinone biosynthesis (AarF/ABC1/UbiB family)